MVWLVTAPEAAGCLALLIAGKHPPITCRPQSNAVADRLRAEAAAAREDAAETRALNFALQEELEAQRTACAEAGAALAAAQHQLRGLQVRRQSAWAGEEGQGPPAAADLVGRLRHPCPS